MAMVVNWNQSEIEHGGPVAAPRQPAIIQSGPPGLPINTGRQPSFPIITGSHPQPPIITGSRPQSPIITGSHPQSPIITGSHPQSPIITDSHPQSLINTGLQPGGHSAGPPETVSTVSREAHFAHPPLWRAPICNSAPRTARAAPRTRKGFTLIEVIGVLAVLAILASLLVPVVVKQVDQAAWTKEYSDLASISNAIVMQAIRSNSIPDSSAGPNGWAQAAANWLNRPVSQILSTPRTYQRALVVDPALINSGLTLPYTQSGNSGLLNAPTNSRLIIVSTLSGGSPVSNGMRLSQGDFQALWDTPQRAIPRTSMTWPMSGDDICIQRINLEPLFFQLILVNRWATNANAAMFSINSNSPTNVANGGFGDNFFYLDGTVVSLYSVDSSTNLQARFLMKRNASYVFENSQWLGQIMTAPPVTNAATLFALNAYQFYNTNNNPRSIGTSPGDVLRQMLGYMADYSMSPAGIAVATAATNLNIAAGTSGLLYTPQGSTNGNGGGNGGGEDGSGK